MASGMSYFITAQWVSARGLLWCLRMAGEGPTLLLLHGFTGSSKSWEPLFPAFASRFSVLAPDLIGHGQSAAPRDPHRYSMEEAVSDLLALLDQQGIDQCAVLGYSLGGRLALTLAAAAPDRIRALVLESASPGIADPRERASRRNQDEALARAIETRGIKWFVAYWEHQPLFATQRRLPETVQATVRSERLAQRPWGLANSLRGMGAGVMTPLWEKLPELSLPTLLIVGALDEKYQLLGQAMATLMPQATLVVVPEAGHTVHLEQPDLFKEIVISFLQDVVPTINLA